MATAQGKTVSLRSAWIALGGVALLGFAGIVAALSVPMKAAPVAPPKAAAAAPAPKPPVTTPAEPAAPPTTYAVAAYLQRPDSFNHGDWIWKDEGVPAGPVLILVDIKTQLIHVFRSGREIGTAAVLYGADDSPTPLGIFPIIDKDADHVSSTFGAPMPYNLRLTGDGIAVHGSDHMKYGWATNGCIGIPTPFAKILFDQVQPGDKVVIVKGNTPAPGGTVPLV
jgi:lipoprotein-anchoring transpeptidase ErfK/SrfK